MTGGAGSGEAGGARHGWGLGSEGRVVDVGHRFLAGDVVRRAVVVVAMDLVAVARFEQVKEVRDEVVDLDDRVVTEPGHRYRGAGGFVWVSGHGRHRRAAVRRGAWVSGCAKTSR